VTLVLHEHPFASYCQKVLIALHELELPFERVLVEGREEHRNLWPLDTIPVLVDADDGLMLP
jgi:glutathione S-transferase